MSSWFPPSPWPSFSVDGLRHLKFFVPLVYHILLIKYNIDGTKKDEGIISEQ